MGAFFCTVMAMTFVGCSVPGFAPNTMEVGGPHGSAIFAVQNTLASVPGFVSPMINGLFTQNFGNEQGYHCTFILCCIVYIVSAVLWVCGASVEPIDIPH